MDVTGWRCWYTNDRAFDSRNADWETLPDGGVLAVMVYYDNFTADGEVRYRKLYDGDDWYWRDPETGAFHTAMDPLDDADVSPDDDVVKEGEEISDEAFAAIKQRAVNATWDEDETADAADDDNGGVKGRSGG